MPTLPLKATKIPDSSASLEEYVARALEMIVDTSPFDVTGHPAMNVPCAMSEGLPIGMMLVGRSGEDASLLRAADAFQRHVFNDQPRQPRPPWRRCCRVASSRKYVARGRTARPSNDR
jgi:amidase